MCTGAHIRVRICAPSAPLKMSTMVLIFARYVPAYLFHPRKCAPCIYRLILSFTALSSKGALKKTCTNSHFFCGCSFFVAVGESFFQRPLSSSVPSEQLHTLTGRSKNHSTPQAPCKTSVINFRQSSPTLNALLSSLQVK